MTDLIEADALAHQLIRRIDGGDHDLTAEQAAALRECAYELRVRIRRYPALRWDLLNPVFAALAAGAVLGLSAQWLLAGGRVRQLLIQLPAAAVLVAGTIALVALWRRRLRRMVPRTVPDGAEAAAPEALPDHADALARAVLAATRSAKPRYRAAATHLDACAARVWSLAHGGPVVRTSDVDGTSEWPLARRLGGIAGHVHLLMHELRADSTAGEGDASLLRSLARYDEAWRILHTLRERRVPRPPKWLRTTGIGLAAVLAVVASANYAGTDWIVAALTLAISAGLTSLALRLESCDRQVRPEGGEGREDVLAALSAAMVATWQEDPAQDTLRRAQELIADA